MNYDNNDTFVVRYYEQRIKEINYNIEKQVHFRMEEGYKYRITNMSSIIPCCLNKIEYDIWKKEIIGSVGNKYKIYKRINKNIPLHVKSDASFEYLYFKAPNFPKLYTNNYMFKKKFQYNELIRSALCEIVFRYDNYSGKLSLKFHYGCWKLQSDGNWVFI